ncbi:MAG: cobalamin B12-binding domain-containing protein [Candidatus Omnitrophica bacterium]|nr:cobalamin B12-binding domain-containing protein [Candidatus Omnitrophota bacterium]
MIYPCQGNMTSFNHGLASLIAVLKQRGHRVHLMLVDDYTGPRRILKDITDFKADLVGFSCASNYWQYVKTLSRKMRSVTGLKNMPIFVGAPHAISCPSSLAESPDIDGFCVSEAGILRILPAFISGIERVA